jgi:preprotein translocase subunit YajC
LESSSRVLTVQERSQLSAWRKAALSILAAGALAFKAPEFLPLMQATPMVGSVLLMAVFIFLAHKIQKRLSRSELTKPGDRWLLFAGISAAVASFGHLLSSIITYLADSFMVTMAFSTGMGAAATIVTFAPLVIAIVFLCVWWARRQSISPFGKSDGW